MEKNSATPPLLSGHRRLKVKTKCTVQTHTNHYLSHEIGEEEHVAEESCPSKQVTDTQAAVVAWHVDDDFHQRPECHPLLGLHTTRKTSQTSLPATTTLT